MFPISFPLEILKSSPAGLVVDPFCGRGTTNLAARTLGRPTVGIDSSPVAVAATAAKLVSKHITVDEILALAKEIIAERPNPYVPDGPFWDAAYHRNVLKNLCSLRRGLMDRPKSDSAKALRGIILGGLHGPKQKCGSSSYFSNQAPRTYAPKPQYALKFWRKHGHKPPNVDILEIIKLRATRAFGKPIPTVSARVRRADSRVVRWSNLLEGIGPIQTIVTSPPYYGLNTYRPDQWIREWFLGGASTVQYRKDGQLSHLSPEHFSKDLKKIWSALAGQAASDVLMVIRFGAINNRPITPEDLIRDSLQESGWKVTRIRPAGLSSAGKRQAKSFSKNIRPAVEEIDVRCRLA